MCTKAHFTGKILAFIRTKMRTKTSRHVYPVAECVKKDRRRGRGENVVALEPGNVTIPGLFFFFDQAEAKGYSDGAYQNEPEGCGRCARPFGSIVDDLLSPAAAR